MCLKENQGVTPDENSNMTLLDAPELSSMRGVLAESDSLVDLHPSLSGDFIM